MADLQKITISLLEGVAVSAAIYLVTKKQLQITELVTLALSIGVTFLILDLFAPRVASSARQGAGFGLGYKQVGGGPTPLPSAYFGSNLIPKAQNNSVVEGMDDPDAVQYFQKYNPNGESVSNGVEPSFQRQYKIVQPSDQVPVGVSGVSGISGHQDLEYETPNSSKCRNDIPSPIARKLQENPFDTQVRSASEVKRPGAYYISKAQQTQQTQQRSSDPLLYNPLKPSYGYRQDLPRNWD